MFHIQGKQIMTHLIYLFTDDPSSSPAVMRELCRICVKIQIQPKKHALDYADWAGPTWKHELEHATSGIYQSRSWSGNDMYDLSVAWNVLVDVRTYGVVFVRANVDQERLKVVLTVGPHVPGSDNH